MNTLELHYPMIQFLMKLWYLLFQERSLTGSESEREKGLRVFKSHDQQGIAKNSHEFR